MMVMDEEQRARAVDDMKTISERDLLLNVGEERSLILCTALDEQRVKRMVASIDCAWSVGLSTPCTRGAVHRHWALIRN